MKSLGTFQSAAELGEAVSKELGLPPKEGPEMAGRPGSSYPPIFGLGCGATSSPPNRCLIWKLAEVMAAVERVPKRGHNAHFNYDFATESDITSAIRRELAARHLMLIPDVQGLTWRDVTTKAGTQQICCVRIRFTVHDGDSGETLEFSMPGEGQDGGDKCVPKALTSALKYACLKLFLIPTGDDPEKDITDTDTNTSPIGPKRAEDASGSTISPQDGAVLVRRVSTKQGTTTTGKPWTLHVIDFSDGRSGSTFDAEIAAFAKKCVETEIRVQPTLAPGKKAGHITVTELAAAADYGPPPLPADDIPF